MATIKKNNMTTKGQENLSLEDSKLPLERLFDTANAKVLDFLFSNEDLDYTDNEISELAAIPERTLQRSLQILLHEKIIKRTKKKGRVFYYTLNLSSPRVENLFNYVNSTLIYNLDQFPQKPS
ncbi:MAG: hypothetical protein D9C04_06240 [Nitrosopumilus sp. B06]|nr:MAG: hypothetical protein D9C04_06240 [Nitrosopumilus sp. B06]